MQPMKEVVYCIVFKVINTSSHIRYFKGCAEIIETYAYKILKSNDSIVKIVRSGKFQQIFDIFALPNI